MKRILTNMKEQVQKKLFRSKTAQIKGECISDEELMKQDSDDSITVLRDQDLRTSSRTSLNRLCDISDWKAYTGDLYDIFKDLGEGTYIHRKSWEYAMCIYGLDRLEAVKPDSTAIAVGAGHERPLFYYANRIKKMVATDLYSNCNTDADSEMLTNPEKFSPFPFRKEHLEVHQMNGTDLKFEDDSYDFAFSLSAIEHFGSRDTIKKAMSELYRVLKPGGILCLTTELILNKSNHQEYFTVEEFKKYILDSTPFKLVGGDFDLRISRSLVSNPIDLRIEKDLHISPHIVLKDGKVIWTSIVCFLKKDTINYQVQTDHLQRMKKDSPDIQEYWRKIMNIRYPKYLNLIKKNKLQGKLLDIGCGFSDVLFQEYMYPAGYEYYCTDLNPDVVNHMRDLIQCQGKDCYSLIGCLENLPWKDNFFDIVYACHILEHTTDITKALSEIKRVLKPDGILLFGVPCGIDEEPAHLHNRDIDGWREDFQNSRWEIVEWGRFDFNNNEFYGILKVIP
jgi:ubiquinone/menaquinone biosynthesis C-methylase UbiE